MMIRNILAVSLFVLMPLIIVFEFYVVKTKLQLIERYFQDNQMVRSESSGMTYRNRALRLSLFGSIFLLSRLYIWRGLVSQPEIEEVPPKLRLWVMAPLCGHTFVMVGLTLFWIFK